MARAICEEVAKFFTTGAIILPIKSEGSDSSRLSFIPDSTLFRVVL